MAQGRGSADALSDVAKPSLRPPRKDAAGAAGAAVADSWEEDDESDGGGDTPSPGDRDAGDNDGTAAPPPTPVSTNFERSARQQHTFTPLNSPTSPTAQLPRMNLGGEPSRRPEKTDAVARRMIAGALGVKAPKLTEEQKAYERAMKEKERKARDAERKAEAKRIEDAEKAKVAIWDD